MAVVVARCGVAVRVAVAVAVRVRGAVVGSCLVAMARCGGVVGGAVTRVKGGVAVVVRVLGRGGVALVVGGGMVAGSCVVGMAAVGRVFGG
ncbi:hypothetical protein CLV68_2741 [Actinokineospora cianjurensis]|uniref:Uncharacterized protein n=1 Tax=Actinokineospora cianjurensis TaxID=585224 RepID=A0A421BCX5_9PSEU|nr:hypothetical protein CLV68_2741 [Actinokineospora cianjurensis]